MKTPKTASADMRWFRLYHDVLDDEKVQELRPELFKFWVNLLCLASKGDHRGRVPSKPSSISFRVRVEATKAKAMLEQLEAAGLIDKEGEHTYVMHNWDKRQPASDNAAARQRAHRNGARHVTCHVTDNVTGDVTCRNTEKEDTSYPEKSEIVAERQPAHTHSDSDSQDEQPPSPTVTPGREPPDSAEIERAVATLCADLRTHAVGIELGRRHLGTQERQIPGWKWFIAAQKLQGASITLDQMASYPYLLGIAKRVTEGERVKQPSRPRDSPSAAPSYAAPYHQPAPVRPPRPRKPATPPETGS